LISLLVLSNINLVTRRSPT